MARPSGRLYALPLFIALLSACASGPPAVDYAAQARKDADRAMHWQALESGAETAYLNELVGTDELDRLIDTALTSNPGLQQTLLTLQIRRTEARQTGAQRYPDVEAGFSASRDEGEDARYTGSLNVSWEADVWNKIGDEYSAADKDVAEQQALYQSARDTLAAEVMKAWLELIAQQHAIDIEQQRLRTLQRNERFIRQRYRRGIGDLEDLSSARSSVSSTKATLEQYRETLASQRRALQKMLGGEGAREFTMPSDYPEVRLPLSDLPKQNLQRRPDLKAAYLAIQAQALRTQASYKDMLPTLDIQAALEDTATSPREALLTDPLWSLLGQLTLPLFTGGELKAAADEAVLQTAQAYQEYRETLLTAVTEVQDALGQEQALARRQAHIDNALANSRQMLAQYRRKYRAGLVSILDLLDIQEQTYDLQLQQDDLVYQRLVNRIDIGLALSLGVK